MVDRFIGKLKIKLSAMTLTDFPKALKRAVDAYNTDSHSALLGGAPEDVKGNEEIQYELEKQNGLMVRHNNKMWRKKVNKLQEERAFRTPLPNQTWERIDAPKFSGEVHEVKKFEGDEVKDRKGQSFKVRSVAPVPLGSADIDLGDAGPGQGKRAEQREQMEDFAGSLKKVLPETGMSIVAAANFLRSLDNFDETAETYKLPRQGRIVKFLRLYPKLFDLVGAGTSLRVIPKKKEEVAPRAEASSSSDGRRQRILPRMPEIEPRAEPQRYPNYIKIEFVGKNPTKRAGPRRERFEKYKTAKTKGEMRQLGGTSQDITMDIKAGVLLLKE